MCRIARIHAREVFDSRGMPTVEAEVTCVASRPGRAIVPSGASTGKHESVELRDRNDSRLDGKGVARAVENVRGEIAAALIDMDASDQQKVDAMLCALDGTENKGRLGANALLAVSLATAYAAAEAQGITPVDQLNRVWRKLPGGKTAVKTTIGASMSIPLPMVNMISGGLHAGGNLDIQDVLILPVGANSFRQGWESVVTVYRRLGPLLTDAGLEGRLVGDEGGYGPRLKSNEEAIQFVVAAIEAAGFSPGKQVAIGLDVAASHFFKDGLYRLSSTAGGNLTADGMIDMLDDWVQRYPIVSIEDALAEDDWEGWRRLTDRLGRRVQLIGDDLFVTNRARLERGIAAGVCNSVLIKLNQAGTLSETLDTMRLAIDHGYRPVISARSGETEDTTIADLAVATGAGQIKVGSAARSERLAKYNQLLRLEEQLAGRAEYQGGDIFDLLRRD